MRAIDADSLEELFREVIGGIAKKPEMNGNLEHMVRASAMVIEMIQNAPTIEPQRKKGMWEMVSQHENPPTYIYSCSECRHKSFGFYNYCPNCGAEME